jgi:hypothetical protein
LVGKCEGKKLLGKLWHRREGVRVIGWKHVDWIHLAQDRDQWQAEI